MPVPTAEALFGLFAAGTGTVAIGNMTWEMASGLDPANPGEVFHLGGGQHAVVLDGQGRCVQGKLIPEPITMFGIAVGLAGLGG